MDRYDTEGIEQGACDRNQFRPGAEIGTSDAQPYREALKAKTTMKATVKYLTPSLATLCSLTFPQARLTQEIATTDFTSAKFEIASGRGTFSFGA
jgi:hypothetical protein